MTRYCYFCGKKIGTFEQWYAKDNDSQKPLCESCGGKYARLFYTKVDETFESDKAYLIELLNKDIDDEHKERILEAINRTDDGMPNDPVEHEDTNSLSTGKEDTQVKDLKTEDTQVKDLEIEDSTGWIKTLDVCANIAIVLGVIYAIVLGCILTEETVLGGLAVLTLGSVVAVVSVAGIKVFIGMAKDIHYMREKHK